MNIKKLSRLAKTFTGVRINNRKAKISLFLHAILLLSLFYPLLTINKANAAVTESFVRFDRHATTQLISGTTCMKTATVSTEASVVLVFPVGWTIPTAGNWTTTTTNLPTDPVGGGAATAWVTIGATATSVDGLSVVFSSGDLVAGTFYCFNFSGATSAVGSAGNDKTGSTKTRTSANVLIDTVDWATSVVSAGADQISVTASVSATFTFSLTANTIALGTLNTSSAVSGSVTQSVSTNARNGYISWIQGTNTTGGSGLRSTLASATIATPGSFPTISDLASTTGVVLDAVPQTNSPTINAGFDGNGSTSGGNFEGGVFHEVSSKTGAQSGTTVDLNVRAKITSTQAAATDYADTLVVSAAGSF